MKKTIFLGLLAALTMSGFLCLQAVAQGRQSRRPAGPSMMGAGESEFRLTLTNWFIQSSSKIKAGGEAISLPGVLMDKWYPATIPATVLGTLVQNDVYSNIFFGDNLNKIPPDIFKVSWWYRTEFPIAGDPSRTTFKLEFDGINYRANIWLNGNKIAAASEVYGSFRRFEFNVTDSAKRGGMNVLAVEVFPPVPGEPTMGFVDWNPAPPDGNMGIWREVRIKSSGDVSINAPFVTTKLDLGSLKEASLTVSAELRNNSSNKVAGTLEGRLESGKFSREVTLEPMETRTIVLSPKTEPDLLIKNPKIWWTHDLGKPELQVLFLGFQIKGGPKIEPKPEPKAEAKPEGKDNKKAEDEDKDKGNQDNPFGKRGGPYPRVRYSDLRAVRFGIREVSDYVNAEGHRGFKLNGKNILIRGGGWTDDMLLDNKRRKVAAEVAYARHMNLNALRVEGIWGSGEDFYDLCDQNGILVMAGWSCQWEWEHYFGKPVDERYGGIISPEDIQLIALSWRDQVRWLRNHPSIFVWMEGSDLLPKPELEKEYIRILKEDDPTRPALISAKAQTSELTGQSAVKMLGPYDWVPPTYWYVDTRNGGAYGFNTETGPGPQVPPIESLRKMIPENDLWPIGDMWYFHCCRGEFKNLDRYNEAITKRLGPPKDLRDYVTKAQFMNYEAMRGMFEAFTANKYKSTGVIQWMYNSAWPKLWWQLYDYFLMPNGAFYGARKACSPVHIFYNYGSREIIAVNNTLEPVKELKASIRVFDIGLKGKYSKEIQIVLAADEVRKIDVLPEFAGVDQAWFVDLRLASKDKEIEDVNFYCLSPRPEIMDEDNSTWYVTPVKEFADFTALQGLPLVQLKEKHSFKKEGAGQTVTVEIDNPGPGLAFMVEVNVYKSDTGDVVLPIFWEDNFVTLLPGEKRKIQGFFVQDDLAGSEPELKIRGWNIK